MTFKIDDYYWTAINYYNLHLVINSTHSFEPVDMNAVNVIYYFELVWSLVDTNYEAFCDTKLRKLPMNSIGVVKET